MEQDHMCEIIQGAMNQPLDTSPESNGWEALVDLMGQKPQVEKGDHSNPLPQVVNGHRQEERSDPSAPLPAQNQSAA